MAAPLSPLPSDTLIATYARGMARLARKLREGGDHDGARRLVLDATAQVVAYSRGEPSALGGMVAA